MSGRTTARTPTALQGLPAPVELPSGGDAVLDGLLAAGVRVLFGIPASHVIEIDDAVTRRPEVTFIVARNEQTAAYMADGYARRSRRPGVAVVTGGPGLTNALTGLHTAVADSVPVVVVASDLGPEARSRHPLGIPHELADAASAAAGTGAVVHRFDDVLDITRSVRDAVLASVDGRPRPAAIIVSRAALNRSMPERSDSREEPILHQPDPPSAETLERVRDLLAAAQRPLIIAGAGVVRASGGPALAAFLDRTRVPCLTTVPGRSALAAEHPSFVGVLDHPAARALVEQADAVIAIGASFGAATTGGWSLTVPEDLCHVDIDPEELGRHYVPALPIVADAAVFLRAAVGVCEPHPAAGWAASLPPRRHPWLDAVDAALPERQACVAVDVGTITGWVAGGLSCGPRRELMLPWNAMTMGWAYAAALGAAAAGQDDAVVALLGDGGMLFCIGELATAVAHHLPVVAVVFNNRSYGVIAKLQDAACEGRRMGVELQGPDFAAIARGFGMHAATVTEPEALTAALSEALARRAPALIEVMVDLEEFAHP
jgi:thiamine pyrophosphate-dependent acetolactate synthase large subunit-like protein